jgi:hypothetical protein
LDETKKDPKGVKRRREAILYNVYRAVEVKADFEVTERRMKGEKLILMGVLWLL